MKKFVYILFLILFSLNVTAFNNIYEFDDRTNIILTTSVYDAGAPTEEATCNLTVYNPPPNESIINLSVLMNNKGNGIFSYDLTGLLDYNDEIYPIILYCNGSSGNLGSDERVGIKIGVKLYDYLIPGGILITIAFLFTYMSFKVNDELKGLKLLLFYIGQVFILISLFYGLAVTSTIPGGDSFLLIFQVIIPIHILIIVLLIWLQFVDKLEGATKILLGSK